MKIKLTILSNTILDNNKLYKHKIISQTMNKALELILGLILVVVPIWVALTYQAWGAATLTVLMGGVIIGVICIGLLFLLLGISDLKD